MKINKFIAIVVFSFLMGCVPPSTKQTYADGLSPIKQELEKWSEKATGYIKEQGYLDPAIILYTTTPDGSLKVQQIHFGTLETFEEKEAFIKEIAEKTSAKDSHALLVMWEYANNKTTQYLSSTFQKENGIIVAVADNAGKKYFITQSFQKKGKKIIFDYASDVQDGTATDFAILNPLLNIWVK